MRTCVVLMAVLSCWGLCLSQECRRELHVDVDFPGTDLTFVYAADVDHCQQLCTESPLCLFFTFIRSDWTRDKRHFYCYHKSTPTGVPVNQNVLQGVTSGFSLKNCSAEVKASCGSPMYQNVDFLGSDFRSLFTSSAEECQRVCTREPHCRFFTFANALYENQNIRNKCHLKHTWSIPRTPIIQRQNGIISGFSHDIQLTPYFEPECQETLLQNTDIQGKDIATLPAVSVGHCQALCSDSPRCTYFSYTSDTFSCQLKHDVNELVRRPKNGVTSGLPVHFCRMDNSWLKVAHGGVDFPGSDIRFEQLEDAVSCQIICSLDPHCQFYSYYNQTATPTDKRGRCYLKRVITAPAPLTVKKLDNVVSGFSLECP